MLKVLGFEESIGFKSDEWMDRIHPDDLSGFKIQIYSCIRGTEASFEVNYRVRDNTGSWKRVLDKGCVTSWKNSTEPEIISGIKTDITFQSDFNLVTDTIELIDETVGSFDMSNEVDKVKENYFTHVLKTILRLTESEFGFIGSVVSKGSEKFYNIKFCGSRISGVLISENEVPRNLSSHLSVLFQSNKPFICNNPFKEPFDFPGIDDPEVLKCYMIIPIYVGYKLIKIIGIANRLEGYDKLTIAKLIQPTIDALTNLMQTDHQKLDVVNEQNLLKLFIRYTPLAVTMIDINFCYLAASEAWLRLFNLQDKNPIGTPLAQVSGNHVSQKIFDLLRGCLQGKIVKNNVDNVVLSDGSVMWMKWEAHPWYSEKGSAGGVIIFIEDITENKVLEAKMKKMVADLSRSNYELERFTYGCYHDMKEPLRGMACMAHLIIKHNAGSLDETTQEYLQYIINGANRLQRLIQDILVYSKAGIKEFAQENVSIREILNEVKSIYAIQFLEHKVVIKEGFIPQYVWGNREQIIQVFQNIIENAIKFRSKDVPEIFITSEISDDGFWHFLIKDNGIGIEEKYFDDVFVVFKRLHSRQNYQGSGIGLSLCQKIIEMSGGKIWIISNEDSGSTIHFTLPSSPF